jgi:hypothetical protein
MGNRWTSLGCWGDSTVEPLPPRPSTLLVSLVADEGPCTSTRLMSTPSPRSVSRSLSSSWTLSASASPQDPSGSDAVFSTAAAAAAADAPTAAEALSCTTLDEDEYADVLPGRTQERGLDESTEPNPHHQGPKRRRPHPFVIPLPDRFIFCPPSVLASLPNTLHRLPYGDRMRIFAIYNRTVELTRKQPMLPYIASSRYCF